MNKPKLLNQLLWFIGLWLGSVILLSIIASIIKIAILWGLTWGNVIQKYLVHLQKRRSLSRWTLTTSFVAPSQSNDCVLSLGWRHSIEHLDLTTKTREKVCVWCVFESHTYSVSVRKLSHWYYFGKWCPGAASSLSLFPYSGVNLLKTSRILIVYHTARPKHKRNCPTVCLAPAMQSPVTGWVVRSTPIRGDRHCRFKPDTNTQFSDILNLDNHSTLTISS